ncbi:MAG: hypothetical protein JOY54_18965 [Acidobacteriaceae bacterium]|nr:hypothetical protein [Acidobacteriaceae bacterium]
MPEQLYKLTPDRDLQCYFLTPSAIAAMSQASDSGFVLSGKWRQQFDWAVVEWNRNNVFEHPALRNLPNGDLSGLVLTYQEARIGCIPIESNLVPVVDWDNLRIWATPDGGTAEIIYHVPLAPLAAPVGGSVLSASATMTLVASPAVGRRVGLALLEESYSYTVQAGDQLPAIAAGIAADINQSSQTFSASSNETSIVVTWNPRNPNAPYQNLFGANGNRITVYGFAENGAVVWQQPSASFSGGQFPSTYQITIDFGALKAQQNIPTDRIRKLRWTWAADLQTAAFQQTEFQVQVSNWSVSGNNRQYSFAGPGSRRIEDTDAAVSYSGSWSLATGNYSGSKIHATTNAGDTCTVTYSETAPHELYLGTRLLGSGATVNVEVDDQAPVALNLAVPQEDVLIRSPLGSMQPGTHTITLTHGGPPGNSLFFDFLEVAYPALSLPDFNPQTQLALATDWDTYHSQSLPAERTAWLVNKLGFQGRLNHYTGALWFYELVRTGTQYASATVPITDAFWNGAPNVGLALAAPGSSTTTFLGHSIITDDTPETVAQALAGLINLGTNLVSATAAGNQLTVTARAMGREGNEIQLQFGPVIDGQTLASVSASTLLNGGVDGAVYDLDATDPLNSALIAVADYWRTDLSATPPINRAARDWHSAYFAALKSYGIEAVASFSMELMNADPSGAAGIAQCYADGTPVVLHTPSVQTNFSPASLAFWTQVYVEMASLQNAVGLEPYLQFGEVQWWYYPKANVSMPFYDAYTQQQFKARYGVPMQTIMSNTVDPTAFPNETAFLPTLIAAYTSAIRGAVIAQFSGARFEVLYPTDTNDSPLNELINYPTADWTPANLACLKTESFTFTSANNLDQSGYSMGVSAAKGFPNGQRSHLIGISDAWTAWKKEADIAQSAGLESVVLFALDQYCLVGYAPPPFINNSRSVRLAR